MSLPRRSGRRRVSDSIGAEIPLTLLAKEIAAEIQRWSLAPSVARVAAIDEGLCLRLAESLAYLAEVASLADSHAPALAAVEERVRSGPVSPWVFCLYSKLVSELARSPRGDVSGVFASVVDAPGYLPMPA